MTARTRAAKRRAHRHARAMAEACKLSGVTISAAGANDVAARAPLDNRPTPEREAKGAFRRGVVRDGARDVAVYVDDAVTPLRACFASGRINRAQLDAGERFEAVTRAVASAAEPRSCLDMTPRGSSESEPERAARLRAEWVALTRALGLERSSILIAVAVHQAPTGERRDGYRRWRLLIEALDICAAWWGYAEQA